MAKNQSRRSISISGATYSKLKSYCLANDRSMSSVVEELVKEFIGREVTDWSGSSPTPPSDIKDTRPPPTKPEPVGRGEGNIKQF